MDMRFPTPNDNRRRGLRTCCALAIALLALGCAVPARPAAQVPSADVPVMALPVGPAMGDDSGVLEGLVVDAIGKPRANALVRIAISDEAFGTRMETQTERDGTFRLRGLQPGRTYMVIASDTDVELGPLQGRASARAPSHNVVIQMLQAYPPR